MEYKKPKGTRDILPNNYAVWQLMEAKAKDVAGRFNYAQIRTPTFEDASLFLRSVGDSSDIVNKEMYIFKDRGDRVMALRPEGTAGVVRAVVENGLLNEALPLKLFYFANCFRYENPQAGRYRELSQFGVECFGTQSPNADVELILLGKSFLESIGIKNTTLQINSIGCKTCRAKYNQAMRDFAKENNNQLCPDCKRRAEQNPLRMLDCKNTDCQKILQNAPKLKDYLCDECNQHFAEVLKGLDTLGVEYEIVDTLVRGLDYYTKTVFEFENEVDGKKMAVGGGGRYDDLVAEISGKSCPALGFACGLDRLESLVDKNLIQNKPLALIVNAGQVSTAQVLPIAQKIRNLGYNVECNLAERSFSAQMKYANKINADFVFIVGDEEIQNGTITIKNLKTGEQTTKKL
ncbi:MAG: histidine--tRNA ligase [Clostridia bacterium]|nr:histidine--tRNA ligase [Clostridia bacterium]